MIVKENLTNRGSWKLALLIQVHASHDGQIRSATIRLPTGRKLIRPLNLLYPIECGNITENTEQENSYRPLRKAAIKAREQIEKCLAL